MDKRDQLWEQLKETKNPQEKELLKQQLDETSNQLDKVHAKWFGENEREHRDKYPSYKYIFLHKVTIPREVYAKVMEFWKEIAKGFGSHNMNFWGWGEQVFVPAELLDQIQIISVKKLDARQLNQAYSDLQPRHRLENYSDPLY